MSTPCPTTGRLCDTPGRCSQPAGCVRKVWPDTDLDKAAVQTLADHLLQRTPEQERQQRAWMFGDWTLELSDTEPEGVVSLHAVHKVLDNVDFVAKVRGSVYGPKLNVRRCTLGVGCDEVGQCYASAHGEPDRCEVPEAAPFDQAAWERLGTTLHATCDSNPPARCPWDQWKASRDL